MDSSVLCRINVNVSYQHNGVAVVFYCFYLVSVFIIEILDKAIKIMIRIVRLFFDLMVFMIINKLSGTSEIKVTCVLTDAVHSNKKTKA